MIRTRSRLRLAAGLAVATLGLTGASAASAASAPVPPLPKQATAVNLSATQVAAALFVAGDVGRESQIPSGTETVVLEKVLQQLYTDQPKLGATQAVSDIQGLQAALTGSQALSPATLTVMSGNERILALLDELNHSQPPAGVAHAVAQVTAQALADSSNAEQKYGFEFDPSSDARDTLSYTSFSPASTLAHTAALAATNKTFGQARDMLWQQAGHESVFDSTQKLLGENPALQGNTGIAALVKLLAANGTLSTTVGALEQMINSGITQINAQNCTPTSSAGPTSGCSAGALADAKAVAQQCPGGRNCETARTQAMNDTASEIQTIAAQQAATVAEADALGAAGQALQQSEFAAAQAATEIGEEENQYLNAQSDGQAEKAGFDVATLAVTLSVAEVDPVAAATGLFTVVGDAIGFAYSAQDPSQIVLQGIGNISQQLVAFENYTQTAFQALDHQLSGISSQISSATSTLSTDLLQVATQIEHLTSQVGSLESSVTQLQNSVDRLQSEVQSLFSDQKDIDLTNTINGAIGFQHTYNKTIPFQTFTDAATALFTDATTASLSNLVLSNPMTPFDVTGAATNLGTATTSSSLTASINYFNDYPAAVTDSPNIPWAPNQLTSVCAASLGISGDQCLPNPRFWAKSARAYAQLLMENPKDVTPALLTRLGTITQEGQLVANGLQQLSVNNAGSGNHTTGNQTLDAALGYLQNWGAGQGVPGEPSLTQALENEEQSYLASTYTPNLSVVDGNPRLTDAPINPWGGVSQSPDLTGLLTTTSFTNIPPCASEISDVGSSDFNPSDYTLPALTSQIIGFLPKDVLNAARLGIGQITACYTANFASPGGTAVLVGGLQFRYSSYGTPQTTAEVGLDYATLPFDGTCPRPPSEIGNPFAFDPIYALHANWPGVSTTQTPGCAGYATALGQPENQTSRNGIQSALDPELNQAFTDLQRNIYDDILSNGSTLTSGSGPATDVAAAAKRFGAATALLNGYISLGLPQSLASDDALHGLVLGANADAFTTGPSMPYQPDVPAEVVAFYQAAANQQLPNVDPVQLIEQLIPGHALVLRNAIRPHIVASQVQPGGAILAETSPLVGATLDRLDDTCAALQDALGKPGADCQSATAAMSLRTVSHNPTTAQSASRTVTQHASK